ncbi:MAG: hypothetical protein FWC26_14785 [Fibromonadales bacterium]|nr:hypothetical protein [Fibromonadales bacterium]
MRKSHKQEMLALIATMGKMADILPNMQDPAEQIQDILAACQCLRDNLEGENAPECISLLQSIDATVETDNYPSLQLHIKNLASAFAEIKIKKEILFLPYKASMWDSLESIYLAAKEDPDCDAFVMPIPYYDKKDGRFTEMHWETEYPKNISLIDYRKYNIEERRPDMIFIHNPYDDLNIVTSVHPDFFSSRLRNLTDCLVYVPYFVGDGKSIQEHFCTLPACIFAHKVIVYTEQEREIYVREYNKATRESGSKFLALGSPKLDKAINAKREDYEYPDEWKKLINNKKVVFYNTSIGSLLEKSVENNRPSNKYLQKIKKVFEFFKNQKDAVLLWRPHPLLEGTIKSMRPWLEQEYAEIVNEYKAEGYGIYDDSQDLNRAIAISDLYYGDGSSVTKLFDEAKKPVLGQVIGTSAVCGLCDSNDFIWFTDIFNALYRYNKQSKKTEYMGTISLQRNGAFRGIAESNGKLYLASRFGDRIYAFDMDKKVFERKIQCDYEIKDAISFKNYIYFISQEFPAILKYTPNSNEMVKFSPWEKDIYFGNYCVTGDEIALVIAGKNSVMFFNMETGEHAMEIVGEVPEQYSDICFDGQNYYLSSFSKNYIVKWNRQTSKSAKIMLPNSFSRSEDNQNASFSIRYSNKHIWLIPFAANNAYKINLQTEKFIELPSLVSHFESKGFGWYYNLTVANENLIYASTPNKGIVEFDISTSKLSFFEPSAVENFIEPSLRYYTTKYKAPAEWKDKKVVFYNSKNPQESVFEFFKKRDDAVLLSRAMFDETWNLDRAIAVSDVYYGDAGNVMALFNWEKKKVAQQVLAVSINGIFDDGVYIWFIINCSVLYKYDKQSKETECMGIIPASPQNNWANVWVAENNKKLYFAPFFKNDKISVFNMEKKSFERIEFKDDCKYDRKFKAVISFKNFVYFIPYDFPAIMKLNVDTNEIEYFSEWVEKISKLQTSKLPHEIWKNSKLWGFCVVDTEIAIMIHGANAVMFFNMETCDYEIKSVGEKSEQYNHICFDGQNYYITTFYKDYIVKWNRQTNEVFKIKIPSFSKKDGIGANFSTRYLNGYVWLIPSLANSTYKIDINTNEVTELPEFVEYLDNKNLSGHYGVYCKNEDSFIMSTLKKGIVEYNTKTSELKFIKTAGAVSQLVQLFNDCEKTEENSGKRIWGYLKEALP